MLTTLSSLGLSCQTTHQLARHALETDLQFSKGPFDWLICPPQSLARWLDAGLPDFERGDITERRGHAYWAQFGFWFWHGFFTGPAGERVLDIEATFEREREKLAYQRGVFSRLDPSSTLFVLSNSQNNLSGDVFTPDETNRYHLTSPLQHQVTGSLCRFFGADINLAWITRADRCTESVARAPNTILIGPEGSQWKGCDEDWRAALTALLVA